MNDDVQTREDVPELSNPLSLEGLEFVEYATTRPQALGEALERLGFRPVARHRSREVTLYRQGAMNMVVNAHPDDARVTATHGGNPVLSAVAFRVQDARRAHTRCLERGAWDALSHASAMELHIPSIQGAGGSRIYFVDRWREFSIFDIDFVPVPGVDPNPPALAGMRYFGIVQYVGMERSADWLAYYEALFGFTRVPDEERYGIMPKGQLMRSPCGQVMWQLVEPDSWSGQIDTTPEGLQRIGIAVPDVKQTVALLKGRGVEFFQPRNPHPEDRGALTRTVLGSVTFEFVHEPD